MKDNIFLLDTSAWILSLGKSALPAATNRVRKLLDEKTVAITPVVALELLGGTRTAEEFNRLKSRLDALYQIFIGKKEWEEAAKLAFQLHRKGKIIPYTDILIATVAIEAGATLVHADRHFDMMSEIKGFYIESFLPLIQKNKRS